MRDRAAYNTTITITVVNDLKSIRKKRIAIFFITTKSFLSGPVSTKALRTICIQTYYKKLGL